MTIRSRIFAVTYDRMIAKTESAGLAAHRAGLLNGVTGRVLEIGGGTGANLVHYGSGLESLTVTEPESAMLKRLRRRVEQVAPTATVLRAPAEDLPFDDGVFDAVVTVATLHHVAAAPDVRAMLAELVRVTRPAGRIVVWDHNPRNPYWPVVMSRVPQDTGDERLIPEREVLAGLHGAGARVLAARQLGWMPDFVPPRALPAVAIAERTLERTPLLRRLGAHNVVLAAPPA